ncbi:DUF6426 family protein [Kitasatospora sp. NPDC051853]|uniref:DUF6426 family protein n=1 Tax=Kitasatospora sp. NPDC051853 TaxID=3364058 RepID=UPI003790A99D
MELRKFAAAAALGTTVLTVVPALVVPQEAAAGCWGPSYSDCTPDDPGPGDSFGGDGYASISFGDVGDWLSGGQSVVITGRREQAVDYPGDPYRPAEYWGSGSGGGGGGGESVFGGHGLTVGAVVLGAGQTWNERQNCYKNPNDVPTKINQSVSYQVSYKGSASISAKAHEMLTVHIGAEINTSKTLTYALEMTLNPGQTWALNVEYQTVAYAVRTASFGVYTTEYLNVTKPTGTVSFTSC